METKYYPIDEASAHRAKDANSFSDYKPGSATAEYRRMVDKAAEIAQQQKRRVDPMHHEKIDHLLDTYARLLARNMNKGYEIAARCPSVLVAGPSNFPVRKKRKQNAASDRNMKEWQRIQGLLDRIRSTGMGGISSDDPQAVQKLEKKLAALKAVQQMMKDVNAHYRKHKTLDGCPHLKPEQVEKLKAEMDSQPGSPPFFGWQLSNNNAEIRRVQQRIAQLGRRSETQYTGWAFDGGTVEINREVNRLQIVFVDKPAADLRAELKANGFRWAPSQGAWQRQLNDNAIRAIKRIKALEPVADAAPGGTPSGAVSTPV